MNKKESRDFEKKNFICTAVSLPYYGKRSNLSRPKSRGKGKIRFDGFRKKCEIGLSGYKTERQKQTEGKRMGL